MSSSEPECFQQTASRNAAKSSTLTPDAAPSCPFACPPGYADPYRASAECQSCGACRPAKTQAEGLRDRSLDWSTTPTRTHRRLQPSQQRSRRSAATGCCPLPISVLPATRCPRRHRRSSNSSTGHTSRGRCAFGPPHRQRRHRPHPRPRRSRNAPVHRASGTPTATRSQSDSCSRARERPAKEDSYRERAPRKRGHPTRVGPQDQANRPTGIVHGSILDEGYDKPHAYTVPSSVETVQQGACPAVIDA